MMNSQEPEDTQAPQSPKISRVEIIDLEDEEPLDEEGNGSSILDGDTSRPNAQPVENHHSNAADMQGFRNILSRIPAPAPHPGDQAPQHGALHPPPPKPAKQTRYQQVLEENQQLREHNRQLLHQIDQQPAYAAQVEEQSRQRTAQVLEQNRQLRLQLDALIARVVFAVNTARTEGAELGRGAPGAGAE